MAERIERRAFLGLLGLGALAAVDAAYINRFGAREYKLTPDVLPVLNHMAMMLSGSISAAPSLLEEFYLKSNGKKYKPSLNAEVLARTILYLAYLDGGEAVVNRTYATIQDKNLVLGEETNPRSGGTASLGGVNSGPVEIRIQKHLIPDYLADLPKPSVDYLFWHEIYHVLQFDRGALFAIPNVIRTLTIAGTGVGLGVSASMAFFKRFDKLIENHPFSSIALSFVITLGVGLEVMSGYDNVKYSIDPIETQADIQGGSLGKGNPGKLGAFLPEALRGKIFSFQEVQ